jgi:hypothetical protein
MAVLFRIVARFVTLWVLGAMRRRATATPGTVPGGRNPAADAEALRRRVARLRGAVVEGVRITGHAVSLAAFLIATAVLVTAGTTAASLGPRWFGIVCLVVAVPAGLAAARELRVVWRLRRAQHRRQRAERLRGSSGL